MKKQWMKLLMVMFCVLVLGMVCKPVKSYAATDYVTSKTDFNVDDYRIYMNTGKIYVKQSGGSKKLVFTPPKNYSLGTQLCSNGKKIYFSIYSIADKKGKLYSMNMDGSGRQFLCSVKTIFIGVGHVYGNKVYFFHDNGTDTYYTHTYEYNCSTKAVRKVASYVVPRDGKNQYVYMAEISHGPSPLLVRIYNAKENTYTTVTKNAASAKLIGSYVYYAVYSSYNGESNNAFKVYRMKIDGTGRTRLVNTFYGDYINKVTSKYVEYSRNGYHYTRTY